jgi:DHA2 family multidrug resistance protein
MSSADPAVSRPPVNPWVIAGTVTIATFMEVLDTSIANVALEHIRGSLGAAPTDADWVITSYLVANAVVLPLSGWLSSVLGRRNYYLICVALFTAASALCGMAQSLGQLILFRILQGLGGGGLQPTTQGVLLDTFPREKQGPAMAVYTVCVLVAPILGPTLGGWITDNYSWRWIFYINLPTGLVALLLVSVVLKDPDYLKRRRAELLGGPLHFDYVGLGLIALGLGSLEVLLSKGQEWDWLGDPFFRVHWLAAGAVVGIGGAVVWELTTPHPIVDLRVMRDRNFLASSLTIFVLIGTLYGSITLLPGMLQTLMGYDATHAGLVLSPAGLFAMAAAMLSGILLARGTDARGLIVCGAVVLAAGNWWMSQLNLSISPWQVVWPRVVQMLGTSMMFAPLNVAAFYYLSGARRAGATGLFNLLRNEGGSVGTSLAATLLARRQQFHSARLGESLGPLNTNLNDFLNQATGFFQQHNGDPVTARQQAWAAMDQLRTQQASALSYFDVFYVYALVALAIIGLALFMRRSVPAKGEHLGAE